MAYDYRTSNLQTWAHNPATRAFHLGKAEIWAGSRLGIAAIADECSLIVRLNGDAVQNRAVVSANAAARVLLPKMVTETPIRPEISVDWADFSTPNLPRSWWEALTRALAEVDGMVGLHCESGHGRTGTALALLYGLGTKFGYIAGAKERDCAVAAIRTLYDGNSVESEEQIRYIRSMGVTADADARETLWSAQSLIQPKTEVKSAAAAAEVLGGKVVQQQMSDLKPYGVDPGNDEDEWGEHEEWVYDPKTGKWVKGIAAGPRHGGKGKGKGKK